MRLFVLTTISESGDHYQYCIKHATEPTVDELKAFLVEHSSDKDEDQRELYEHVESVTEIDANCARKIPKVNITTLRGWRTAGEVDADE